MHIQSMNNRILETRKLLVSSLYINC